MSVPNNLANAMAEDISFAIDTPWDSIDILKTITADDLEKIIDGVREKLSHDLEFELGDLSAYQIQTEVEGEEDE